MGECARRWLFLRERERTPAAIAYALARFPPFRRMCPRMPAPVVPNHQKKRNDVRIVNSAPATSDQTELRGIPGRGTGGPNAKGHAKIDPEIAELETTYFMNRPYHDAGSSCTPVQLEQGSSLQSAHAFNIASKTAGWFARSTRSSRASLGVGMICIVRINK